MVPYQKLEQKTAMGTTFRCFSFVVLCVPLW